MQEHRKAVGVSGIKPPERLSPAVYLEIKARIVSGQYSPGEWLSVEELCRVFQVSRQPITAALRRLAGDWLVEVIPQVGCRVVEYDRGALADFVNMFGELEARIATLAARRRTPEQLEHLAALSNQIRGHNTLDAESRRLGREFHDTILKMAHSSVLARLCERMWDLGTFASTVLDRALVEPEAVRRRSEILDQLVQAIRLRNESLARLQVEFWLTAVTGSLRGGAQPRFDPGLNSREGHDSPH
jgi:DNA-binding GntR family transcriptional regulator